MNDCYRNLLSLQNALIEIQFEYLTLLCAYNYFLCEGKKLLPKDESVHQKRIERLKRIDNLLGNLINHKLTITGNLNRLNGLGTSAKTNSFIGNHEDWVDFLQSMEKGDISPIFKEIKTLAKVVLPIQFASAYSAYDQLVDQTDNAVYNILLKLETEIKGVMTNINIARIIYEFAENNTSRDLELSFFGKTNANRPTRLRLVK